MTTNRKVTQDDVLMLVYRRNEFYKKKYHLALGVYALSLVVILILSGMLYFLIKHPTHPLYFVTDDVGRLIQETPLQEPNMPLDQVIDWTIEAVEAAYSYDFVNYRSQLQDAEKYFTDYGWDKYMQGLEASNNLLTLDQRKFIFIAKVVEKPKLLNRGIVGGAYAYKFELPVLVTYLYPPFDDKSRFENALYVTATVQRRPLLQSYNGLGLLQINASQATQQEATQNLSAAPPPPS